MTIPGRFPLGTSGKLQMVPEWGDHPASAPAYGRFIVRFLKKTVKMGDL
jgi:hypothetical protein